MKSFASALEDKDLDAIRVCPKADLHNHGFLSGDRGFIAQRTGRDIAPVEEPLAGIHAMHDWVARNIGDLMSGAEGRLLGCEAALALACRDGVTRIAFGDDVWMITQGIGNAAEIFGSHKRLHERVAPAVEWIPQLGLSRHCSIVALEHWLAPFLEIDSYTCIDLSGDEFAQPIELFTPVYRAAKAKGLRLKAHVGEFGTADDVWRAVETLELDEVQHGIAAADSSKVMKFLADNAIRLNICPTSNLLLGRVPSLELHPIRRLFDAGVVVTINTDDALVFGRSVSEEFLALYEAGVFTAEELDRIRLNGLTDAPA